MVNFRSFIIASAALLPGFVNALSTIASPVLYQCAPAAFAYTCDTPPCSIVITTSGDAASSIASFTANAASGTVSWTVDQLAGASVTAFIYDVSGVARNHAATVVFPGPGTYCLSASASSETSAAATSGGTSSSSAGNSSSTGSSVSSSSTSATGTSTRTSASSASTSAATSASSATTTKANGTVADTLAVRKQDFDSNEPARFPPAALLFPADSSSMQGLFAMDGRSRLFGRQECSAGSGYCSNFGGCCPRGWGCCVTGCYPLDGQCCSTGLYCSAGNICVLYDGEQVCCKDLSCTGYGAATTTAPPEITSATATAAPKTTSAPVVPYEYYYWTITWYYYSYWYTYYEASSYSTIDSTKYTETTVVSVYATDSTDASASFSHLSATISLPTPAYATSLPPLISPAPSATKSLPPLTSFSSATGTATGPFSGGEGLTSGGAMVIVPNPRGGNGGWAILFGIMVSVFVMMVWL